MSTCALPPPPASRPTEWFATQPNDIGFGSYQLVIASYELRCFALRDGPPPRGLRHVVDPVWFHCHFAIKD